MQFNSSDSGSSLQSEINITPLVDVVLVLLIIFMVVVPLLMEGYDVDIPRASADTSAPVAESQLILGIGATACPILTPPAGEGIPRSEERRVGKGWRARWGAEEAKKKGEKRKR